MGTRVATGGRRTATIEFTNQSARSSSTKTSSSSSSSNHPKIHHHHHRNNNKKYSKPREREYEIIDSAKQRQSSSQIVVERQGIKSEVEDKLKTKKNNTKTVNLTKLDENDVIIPEEQLEILTNQILDQTKQIGFFDEVRMRLIDQIESSREFQKVKDEFDRGVEQFCSKADLSLARPKLRDQLQAKTFGNDESKLNCRLKECIDRITYKYAQEKLRPLYNEHATRFLEEKQYVIKQEPSSNISKHIADDNKDDDDNDESDRITDHLDHQNNFHHEASHQNQELLLPSTSATNKTTIIIQQEQHQVQDDGELELELEQFISSCCSSQADSGFSITPPTSCRRRESISASCQKLTPETSIEASNSLHLDEDKSNQYSSENVEHETVLAAKMPTNDAMIGIMIHSNELLKADEEKELPKGKLANRYARRRERRIRTKDNWRRLKAQLESLS